jgi:hypothetical protein
MVCSVACLLCCLFQLIALTDSPVYAQCGSLAAIASILKHGKREDLLPHAQRLFKWILAIKYQENHNTLVRKFGVKVIQRIGKIYDYCKLIICKLPYIQTVMQYGCSCAVIGQRYCVWLTRTAFTLTAWVGHFISGLTLHRKRICLYKVKKLGLSLHGALSTCC